ncbi:MAG: acyltransferase family protein [Bacteroidales bacterium]
MQTATLEPKNHFEILDGLRGVAAISVVVMHLLAPFSYDLDYLQYFNHGYLAVDFFFLLSGFVIGHAYDDRWDRMSIGDFFLRRLIRLHPMIIVGTLLGAVGFYFGASPDVFPLISETPVWKLILVMLIGFTLLPVGKSLDIRGWGEMHPLNGPQWSLLYEYIANILYAFWIRKWKQRTLALFVFIAAIAVFYLALTSKTNDLNGGWSLDPVHLQFGFTRLIFPFFAGLLLVRIQKPTKINNAFFWSSLLLLIIFAFPRIQLAGFGLANGLFEAVAVVFIFPAIVYIGANGVVKRALPAKICRFLGVISYPLYITHYPLVYVFNVWVIDHQISIGKGWPVALLCFSVALLIAYLSLKIYDEPLRKRLTAWQKGRK